MADEQSLVPVSESMQHDLSNGYRSTIDLSSVPYFGISYHRLDVQGQSEYCQQEPEASSVKQHPIFHYYYLDIGYVRTELDTCFGSGNWGYVVVDRRLGKSPIPTKSGADFLICVIEIALLIQWADGNKMQYRGMGESRYMPNSNPNATLAGTNNAAESEALKAAARHLGRRFGASLKDDIDEGLLSGAEDERMLKEVLASPGRRLYPDKVTGEDILLTDKRLVEACQQYTNVADPSQLSGLGLLNIYRLITQYPTVDDRTELINAARKLGISLKGGEPFKQIKKMVTDAQDRLANSI